MKKSTAYNITKLIQQFLETAKEIKTQYIDTGKYTLEDSGDGETPSIKSLMHRLIVWCEEDDASRYMGTPYLNEDTMSAYAEHIIDNGDTIASGKVSTEQLETLNSVIESFNSIAMTSEGKFSGVPSMITSVYNTLMYIKEWHQEYAPKPSTLSVEQKQNANSKKETLTSAEYFIYIERVKEIQKLFDNLFVTNGAMGTPLYSTFFQEDEVEVEITYEIYQSLFQGHGYLTDECKTLLKAIIDSRDYKTAELLYYIDKEKHTNWKGKLWVWQEVLYKFNNEKDKNDHRSELQVLKDDYPELHCLWEMFKDLGSWLEKETGNRALSIYDSWNKEIEDEFCNLPVTDFVVLLMEIEHKSTHNIELGKFWGLQRMSIYEYLERNTKGFEEERMRILVHEMENEKNKFKTFLKLDDYLPDNEIKGYEEMSEEELEAERIPNFPKYDYAIGVLCEKLGYEEDYRSNICIYDGLPYIKYKIPLEDVEIRKLRARRSESAPDTIKAFDAGTHYSCHTIMGPIDHTAPNDKSGTLKNNANENTTPIDEVFREEVKPYKRKAIFDHIEESKDNPNAHNYIGAIAEALRNNKMVNNKYADFAKLAPFLGKSVGIDEAKMNIRATKIGQVHKTNAERFIQQVVKSRGPRK